MHIKLFSSVVSILRLLLVTTLIVMTSVAMASPEQKIKSMGITLSEKPAPTANFVYAVTSGSLLFTAGHIPADETGKFITGKIGKDLTMEQGKYAARQTGISLLATLQQELGSLDRVKRIVKVTGMLNATPDFTQHSQVMNGFSDLMVDVFGDKGKHARSAVGMGSLPINAAIEIEMIVEIED